MTDFPYPTTWDRAGLAAIGFEGFVTFADVRKPRELRMPRGRGVYAVLRSSLDAPAFLPASSASGAPYQVEHLRRRWIDHCEVVYIGKADGTMGIHQRLKQYARRGASHTGGRAVWQLDEADQLVVCWAVTEPELGRLVEARWIAEFARRFGQRPFANLAD